MRHLVALACALLCVACGGDTEPARMCTEIGCQDGLVIGFRPDAGWPAGDYRFEVRTDRYEVSCRGSLPLPSCVEPGAAAEQRNVSCNVEGVVQVAESGCALPAEAHGFPELLFDPKHRPARVELRVTRDGQLVGEKNFAPQFQRLQPNGPDCEPTCEFASEVVELQFESREGPATE